MIALLIIISIIILWATLSTLVYKIMTDVMNIDLDEDPRVILSTMFSPIGILILIGYVIGLVLIKISNYFIVCITKKLKNKRGGIF